VISISNFKRSANEDFDDYFVRLFKNKTVYDLNCEDIAQLLNDERGVDFGESAWRKEYAAFNRGMNYAYKLKTNNIKERILSISDLHVPFQKPVETFSKYIGVTDTLMLNGDIGDCQAISKFPKSYRISPMEELIETRKYLIDLIEYIKPARVVITYGNHDIRFQSYFAKSLDSDLLELMPKTSLELIFVDGFNHYNKRERTKIHYDPLCEVLDNVEIDYTGNWFCQIGKTIFCHPIAFSSGILKTAEKAVEYFRNEGYIFTSLVMAHTHRLGEYPVGNTVMYEQGCCCETKNMHYSDGRLTPSQKEGYIYICQDKDGNLLRENTCLECLN